MINLSSSREDAELHGFNRANAEKDDKSLGQNGLRRKQRSHDRRANSTYRARGISEYSLLSSAFRSADYEC